MEWLQIIALTLTVADGAYACHHIRAGRAVEVGAASLATLLPRPSCTKVVTLKSLMAVPMLMPFFHDRLKLGLTIGSMAGSGVGLTISVYNMRKK